jgi:hypothetical protein
MMQQLRPPHLSEVILCGVERASGPPLYYARGVLSGDWYLTLPVPAEEDPAVRAGLARAYAQGERRVTHPCGASMVRLAWLLKDATDPLNRLRALTLERLLETHGLQAPN